MISEISIKLIEIQWDKKDIPFDNVIFQVYGDSKKHGNNTLLMICKKRSVEEIKKHLESSPDTITNLHFKSGMINMGTWGVDPNEREISLNILQSSMNPPYRLPESDLIPDELKEKPYLIINKGEKGMLPKDVSNIGVK